MWQRRIEAGQEFTDVASIGRSSRVGERVPTITDRAGGAAQEAGCGGVRGTRQSQGRLRRLHERAALPSGHRGDSGDRRRWNANRVRSRRSVATGQRRGNCRRSGGGRACSPAAGVGRSSTARPGGGRPSTAGRSPFGNGRHRLHCRSVCRPNSARVSAARSPTGDFGS